MVLPDCAPVARGSVSAGVCMRMCLYVYVDMCVCIGMGISMHAGMYMSVWVRSYAHA